MIKRAHIMNYWKQFHYTIMLIRRIKAIAMETFKLHNLNPNFMMEMFNIKELTHIVRDSNSVYQHKFEK